jgi:hypothetical protein
MFSSTLASGQYMIVDRVNSRNIVVDAVYSKIAHGYTPSTGNVIINLSKLEKGLLERRYRLKLIGGI